MNFMPGVFSGLVASVASTYFLPGVIPSVGGIPLWAYSFLVVGGASIIFNMISTNVLPFFKGFTAMTISNIIIPSIIGIILVLLVGIITYMAYGTMLSLKSMATLFLVGVLSKMAGDFVMTRLYMLNK